MVNSQTPFELSRISNYFSFFMAKNKTKRYRDAGTGQFVTDAYGKRHPGTTEHETIKRK